MSINEINKSVEYIKQQIDVIPEIGMILGSGLGKIADDIKGKIIPYSEIPGFKSSSVQGHSGNLVVGKLGNKSVVAMQGRLHYYEGYSVQDVIHPVRVMKKLGVKTLIVTNAAGGVNKSFNPGDLMIINDHINLSGQNPLLGPNIEEFGPRFPDMSEAYKKEYIKLAEDTAKELGIKTQKGVYIWLTGPTYETPAEVRMLRGLGADAVGMSTVPEVIIAKHAGIDVLGISCITNMACGILDQPLCHEEVMITSKQVEKDFIALVKSIVDKI